jgi:hypothetical protein
MTAQIPDRLKHDGDSYWVDGQIDLPPAFEPPLEAVILLNTACRRGFNCRWEVRDYKGDLCLFLSGVDLTGRKGDCFRPLDKPILNPISGTVCVFPEDGELPEFADLASAVELEFVDGKLKRSTRDGAVLRSGSKKGLK